MSNRSKIEGNLIKKFGQRLFRSAYGRILSRSQAKDFETLDRVPTLEIELSILEQKIRCLTALENSCTSKSSSPDGSKDWVHDEIFILGSGASLLELNEKERAFLRSKQTIAMNKYLLYWDIIDVWPTYVYLADIHQPSPEVFTRILEEIQSQGELHPPIPILTSDYSAWPCGRLDPIFFKRPHQEGDHPWAESIDEPMYYHKGSLSCLLNLCTVLRLAPKITLLGVDLDSGKAFYSDRYDRDLSLHDHWEKLRTSSGWHPTAVATGGIPPLQEKLPMVFEKMNERGVTVSCYNDNSLLVKLGICPQRERFDSNIQSIE